MTKYIVKITATAKENNPNFAGEIQIWYHGRGDAFWKVDERKEPFLQEWLRHFALDSGYNSECDAKRNYSYRHHDEPYWDNKAEIIKITV